MIRQNRKIQFIILLTLVCLVGTMTIAYAILSTTLNITGNTEVIASSWNVHFANIQPNPMSVTPTKSPIITDSKTIDFSVVLNKPGDFYKFNVDIVNDGSINAMIDSVIKNPTLTEQQSKYIKYEIEYINGENISTKQLLASGETKTISVLLSYRTDITSSDLPTSPTTLNLSIELNYVQADQTSTEITTSPKKINVKSGDLNTIGSEICIGEECFYLINNDGKSVKMLSKYNLYAGYFFTVGTGSTPLENPTGKQDASALGVLPDYLQKRTGVIPFSNTPYWTDYVISYPTYVYNESSNIYTHVENYRTYLESFDITITDARLIKLDELLKLHCTTETCANSKNPWLYSTAYWTGFTNDDIYASGIYLSGKIGCSESGCNMDFGIRPVIEISLTEF